MEILGKRKYSNAFEEKDYRKCMKDNMDVIDEEYDRALRDSDFIYHLNVAVSNLMLLIWDRHLKDHDSNEKYPQWHKVLWVFLIVSLKESFYYK